MFTTSIFSRLQRYYVSKSEYYESIATENTKLRSIATGLDAEDNECFRTEKSILFNNKLDLTSSYQDILDCFGTPQHQLEKSRINKHSVLFYKKKIGDYKVRLEIHVVNKKFLIGFITFNITSEIKKSSIIDMILYKFQINLEKNYLEDFRIYNKNKEFLKVIDSVDLTLVYGKNTSLNNQLIKDIAEEKELKYLSGHHKNQTLLHNNI